MLDSKCFKKFNPKYLKLSTSGWISRKLRTHYIYIYMCVCLESKSKNLSLELLLVIRYSREYLIVYNIIQYKTSIVCLNFKEKVLMQLSLISYNMTSVFRFLKQKKKFSPIRNPFKISTFSFFRLQILLILLNRTSLRNAH